MRFDKLTTKFQEALAEAQSLAVTRDNPYMEAIHVVAAPVAHVDGSAQHARRHHDRDAVGPRGR